MSIEKSLLVDKLQDIQRQQNHRMIQPEKSNSSSLVERRNKNLNQFVVPEYLFEDPMIKSQIKKLIDKQFIQQDFIDHLSQDLNDQESDIIRSINTVETRYKLLVHPVFLVDRAIMWKALLLQDTAATHEYSTSDMHQVITDDVQQHIHDQDQHELMIQILDHYYQQHNEYHYSMIFILSTFLLKISESEVYDVFTRFLELHDIYNNQRLEEFEKSFETTCLELHQHFTDLSIECRQWFSLEFFKYQKQNVLLKLMDMILLRGYHETLQDILMSILKKNQQHLLTLDQPGVLNYLTKFEITMEITKPFIQKICQQQKVDNLLTSMNQLEKDNDDLSKENIKLKLKEMNDEQTVSKLIKRNAILEKRLKKYKAKLANATNNNTPMSVSTQTEDDKNIKFVNSLRESGDFGTLIANAFQVPQELDMALQNVTSELVTVKLENFESKQRYEQLVVCYQQLENQFKENQKIYEQKLSYLQNELEDIQIERDQLLQDQEQVVEMAMVAKKTSTELQVEKLELNKQVDQLTRQVQQLQDDKKNYFMPRESFSEEVFVAHSILFGPTKPVEQEKDEYKTKYIESELRCRELEKYLAEAKVKLAEFEAAKQQKRASYLSHIRRESTESYASSITSLTTTTTLSNYNSKRSSTNTLYSRIWTAFGTNPTLKNNILCDEPPQIIE